MRKILIVFGTRPEAIKMTPIIKEFERNSDFFQIKICVTAQHREMLDQVLELFNIKPDYDLNIMKVGQDLYDITSKILLGMRELFIDYQPDMVLVHGDTATTVATAQASMFQKIPVAHIEAGLRTGDIYSPWPEEANRLLTTQLSKYHFAPTKSNRENLLNENISKNSIVITGNTVIDSLFLILEKIDNDMKLSNKLFQQIQKLGYSLSTNRLVLITGHRRENFGNGFLNICSALKDLAYSYPSVDFVYPVHLNPNVQEPVKKILTGINNVYLINPLDYLPFIYLLNKSYLVLTDSGGVQEEAPSLGKPVIVMRDTTERPEAVEAGTVILVGTDKQKIVENVTKLLEDELEYKKISYAHNPYGDGTASKKIVNFLRENLKR